MTLQRRWQVAGDSHHLQAIRTAVEHGGSLEHGSFLAAARNLRLEAMDFKRQLGGLDPAQREQRCRSFDERAQSLLEHPRLDQPAEERVRLRLRKQLDHRFTFLDHEPVEATNNLAQHQLRPAVIARRLSCSQAGG